MDKKREERDDAKVEKTRVLYSDLVGFLRENSEGPGQATMACLAFVETSLGALTKQYEKASHDDEREFCRVTRDNIVLCINAVLNEYPEQPRADDRETVIETFSKVWGISRPDALEAIDEGAGTYLAMGSEHCWVSGAVICAAIEQALRIAPAKESK